MRDVLVVTPYVIKTYQNASMRREQRKKNRTTEKKGRERGKEAADVSINVTEHTLSFFYSLSLIGVAVACLKSR